MSHVPGRALFGARIAVAVLAVLTVIGLVWQWPSGAEIPSPSGKAPDVYGATVVAVSADDCRTPAPGCLRVTARLEEGPEREQRVSFDVYRLVDIGTGDRLRLVRSDLPDGAVTGGVPVDQYSLSDFERSRPLIILGIVFCLLVLVTARWRGLRALIGLGMSLAIVIWFIVPGILDGRSPLLIATIGATAVMLATISFAHGLGPKGAAACLGTAASLLVTLALAEGFTRFAFLTGFGSEEASFLAAADEDISLRGLLLAGMVIGALGVLDDLTVTQASTVMALRHANPALSARSLFSRGLSVGHDHIVATVNTLVLAYAGASLPALLVFNVADIGFGDAVNGEAVAGQIVGMLVGSLGLIAAVPITTGLAALLASRIPASELHDEGHHH